jgi:hypothetical protein
MAENNGKTSICRVTVEFLRAGPTHNQLVSPLTQYLGICGDSSTGIIHLPYEHAQLMTRLGEMRYQSELPKRQQTLLDLSREVGAVLGGVPGLDKQIEKAAPKPGGLVHLEVVVSAAELALLPFECSGPLEQGANEPGRWLLLSGSPCVSLTRRIRSVRGDGMDWSREPRILFVAAAPENLAIPFDEHLQALQTALQPWLPNSKNNSGNYFKHLDRRLTVLLKPSIADIAAACAKSHYTHVHILAQGMGNPDSPGQHYGIALHSGNPKSPEAAVVSGSQLAAALQNNNGHGGPTMVSLAVCDSGNVQEVVHTGASIIHDLHRNGIPFVVGSQFPLSFDGSVEMTQRLYGGILGGEDPRRVLRDIRLCLYSLLAGQNHDWASLVAYAVFPQDFDRQLETLQYTQSRAAVDVALEQVDQLTKSPIHSTGPLGWLTSDEAVDAWVGGLRERTQAAIESLPQQGRYRSICQALKGASHKRRAEMLFRASLSVQGQAYKANFMSGSLEELHSALRHYDRAVSDVLGCLPDISLNGVSPHWVLTQVLSLSAILHSRLDTDRWGAAKASATVDLMQQTSAERVFWAQASLAELYLLAAWNPGAQPFFRLNGDPLEQMQEGIKPLLQFSSAEIGDFDAVNATAAQFRRYLDWWWSLEWQGGGSSGLPTDGLREAVEGAINNLMPSHRGVKG